MSFYSNFQSDKCPGPINGNALNGLCEKVCIEAKKIFDACIKQNQIDDAHLTLCDFEPANPTCPLTFVSARSSGSEGEILSYDITRLPDKCNCARVQCSVKIPVEVIYVDKNGVEGKAKSYVTVNEDVILFVPAPSIIPYTLSASVSLVAPEGTYSKEGFDVNCCVTVILKICIDVELLVPSYGYCVIPPAQEYSQEVCSGLFELPLYPQGNVTCKK